MSKLPYLYVQRDVQLGSTIYAGATVPCRSLETCVRNVRQDCKAGLKPGTIYVRYSRVASLLRKQKQLEEEIARLKLEA